MIFLFHNNKNIIEADCKRWLVILGKNYRTITGFIYLLSFHPEFRNLFYHRIGISKYFLNIICRKMSTLIIATPQIGPGLFIQHGLATIISAKSIGKIAG
jgi:serine O-acetyltransferase